MNTVGIISEYNPFHAGHAYHIAEAKRLCNADFAVIVMNGDFVQRGEPAIFDKYTRTRQALEGGADLVFELPVRFGVSSAGDFARGGVLALESLGFVSHLCFGSEIGELAPLQEVADLLLEEPESYKELLNRSLRQGLSYPAARALALAAETRLPSAFLNEPNNILGIEYCLALRLLSSSIRAVTIPRQGQGYHDEDTAESTEFPSATSVRKKIIRENAVEHLTLSDFSCAIGYALLSTSDLCSIKDISPDLADRITRFLPSYRDAESLIQQCKNPSLTAGRIRRSLIQCLLGICKTDLSMPYLRLLGMKKEASSLLAQKENASCHILSRLAVDSKKLSLQAAALLKQDLFASDLYRQTWCYKYGTEQQNEYQHSPIVL
ncbi:MAG: nucleotidyltransferase family protein [Eubacterium sp.]|nr:nucleotidyltransferase family protein [Eubacterium sp.]